MVIPVVSLFLERSAYSELAETLNFLRNPASAAGGGMGLSLREIARQLSGTGIRFNESTLRTAFFTEGRRASQRTVDRLSEALSRSDLLTSRSITSRTIQDTFLAGRLSTRFYDGTAPDGARGFMVVVRNRSDPEYEYRTLTPSIPGSLVPQDFFDSLDDVYEPERVIWDVS